MHLQRSRQGCRALLVDDMIDTAGTVVEGAKALGMPIVVTEQYRKGLGPTLKDDAGGSTCHSGGICSRNSPWVSPLVAST